MLVQAAIDKAILFSGGRFYQPSPIETQLKLDAAEDYSNFSPKQQFRVKNNRKLLFVPIQ